MCTASGLSTATTSLQTAGTALSTVGSVFNAVNARKVAKQNAALANQQALDAAKKGNQELEMQAQKVRALKGAQTAALASNGLDLSEGTPLAILNSTDQIGASDAAVIRQNVDRQIWGFRMQANNYSSEAAANNPFLAGTSTLLTGAGQVADSWYKRKAGGY